MTNKLLDPNDPQTWAATAAASRTGNGADSGQTKPSNPKDIIGSRKLPLDIVPDTLETMAAEAFLEGALKYGRYNWRIAGVRASIYYSATKRHMKKWWNGQNADKATRVHHLKSVIACVGIMLDAELFGKLEDDRPPCPDPDAMAELIDAMEAQVAHLKEMFAEHKPYQFTIADTRREEMQRNNDNGFLVPKDRDAAPALSTARYDLNAADQPAFQSGCKPAQDREVSRASLLDHVVEVLQRDDLIRRD